MTSAESIADNARPGSARNRHVYACLAPDSPACAVDLVRNLRYLDPDAAVLLYDGSQAARSLEPASYFERLGAIVHPAPRSVSWRQRHRFAIDCLRFATRELELDSLTFVTNRQMALRAGWSGRVARALGSTGNAGLLGSSSAAQPASSRVGSVMAAWQELPLWQPLLRGFRDGERHFARFSQFPGLTLSAPACRAVVERVDEDAALRAVLDESRSWALEEVLFPTLVGLLGFRLLEAPGSYAHVGPEGAREPPDAEVALADEQAYWLHPVATSYGDERRRKLREHHDQYRLAQSRRGTASGQWPLVSAGNDLADDILRSMRPIEGWLTDAEAKLLISSALTALAECPQAEALVEVGSYCGRATSVLASVVRAARPSARVWAVDPHDGFVGSLDYGLEQVPPSFEKLVENLDTLSLVPFVEIARARAPELSWSRPVCLLLIDGLHDYPHVARDFDCLEPCLVDGALVAFHDYADYFPGVPAFVDELSSSGRYEVVGRARSLIVLRKLASA